MNGTCYFHFNYVTPKFSALEHRPGTVAIAANADGMDIALFLNPAQFEALRQTVNSFQFAPTAEAPTSEAEGKS